MNPVEYDRMYRLEDRYWWFVSRRELVVGWVGALPGGPDRLILDIGCGTGANARALETVGRVVGLDLSPMALSHCRGRGLSRLIRGGAESLPIADSSADVVVATDIIEHLDDDVAALGEFRRVLRPGGHAVITVPAYMFLWSDHDEALMHRRRYSAALLRRRAEQSGLEVVRLTHAFSLLFPMALTRLLGRRSSAKSRPAEARMTPVPPSINALLIQIQRFETAILRHVSLPWGLSIAAVLRRPTGDGDGPAALGRGPRIGSNRNRQRPHHGSARLTVR